MYKSGNLQFATILMLSAALNAAETQANSDIVKWVDSQGVTHFGHQQFAPPDNHEAVEIKPANGMVAPSIPAGSNANSHRLHVVKLDRSKLKNKRGFRGYSGRPSTSRNRNSRRR